MDSREIQELEEDLQLLETHCENLAKRMADYQERHTRMIQLVQKLQTQRDQYYALQK